jgi:O-antigen/teichoic acid export membrane protein
MLIGQASITLTANILSALIGLVSVFVFTRLFSPHAYGVCLLGVGFASVASVFLAGWFRNLILNGHSRDDGTDVRGLVASGFILSCLTVPACYGLARLIGLDATAALAAVALSVAIGLYDLTQDLIRARLMAFRVMQGTLVRSISALGLGLLGAFVSPSGLLLLLAATTACVVAILVQSPTAWRGTTVAFDRHKLAWLARQGLPLTASLTLLAVSSVTDRFMIANLAGAADAGRYVAALDLVRQTLMLPAMSAAAVFFPLAVRIHASNGDVAARSHLAECLELLFGITLPAALGLAMISTHVANVVLGPDFREIAAQTMPIIALAVIFQILTQQYLHASFLLSERNSFYLINTLSIVVANVILSYVLIKSHGTVGAAWARLGADGIGFVCALLLSRRAFPIPLPASRLAPIVIASLLMTLAVGVLDKQLRVTGLAACVLLASTGVATYAVLCWLLDIGGFRRRLQSAFAMLRTKRGNFTIGPNP